MGLTLARLLPGDPDLARVEALNDIAFPPHERVSVDYLLNGLGGMAEELLAVRLDGRFTGFVSMLLDGRCAYLRFLAVLPGARGRGVGGETLRLLRLRYPDRQIVVDFEAPNPALPDCALRERRRNFYLRNGFHATGYYQYYMGEEYEIACSEPVYDRAAYERLLAGIHDRVPEFNPRHYRKD